MTNHKNSKCKEMQTKNDEADALTQSGKFTEAYDVYTQMLAIDPHNICNAFIYYQRARVVHIGAKVGREHEALLDFNNAIEFGYKHGETYFDAFRWRALCYFSSEKYEEAVRDYDKIGVKNRTKEDEQRLQTAKMELKRSYHYKTLGLQKNCGQEEIKAAYRKHARLHHPDRHANKNPEERNQEELKFKEVGKAYAVLSDPEKKRRYDSGQDV